MRQSDAAGGGERSKLEQEVEESRDRLKDRQRKADEAVEDAERLAEQAKKLEEREERLRKQMHDPTGLAFPPEPEAEP